jgi:hypothetical protein
MPKKISDNEGLPPGTLPVSDTSCRDVVMGRGSGTQNHCGNVTYRKLVCLNKVRFDTHVIFQDIIHSPHPTNCSCMS